MVISEIYFSHALKMNYCSEAIFSSVPNILDNLSSFDLKANSRCTKVSGDGGLIADLLGQLGLGPWWQVRKRNGDNLKFIRCHKDNSAPKFACFWTILFVRLLNSGFRIFLIFEVDRNSQRMIYGVTFCDINFLTYISVIWSAISKFIGLGGRIKGLKGLKDKRRLEIRDG